ncbi:MAG: hypothetical protein NUV84_05030 [Candidatus Uhrbacteria bacterium]|nr:hypothetical protein [Candidatus Uhrbacteria bacterium]
MQKLSTGLVLKTVARTSIREMLILPLWWYTTGLYETIGRLLRSVKGSVRYFGVDVWAKNLFVPMYGDESVTGRAISFIVRLAVLGFRLLGVVVWIIASALLALVYVIVLPVAFIGFLAHLLGVIALYA